jgi:hypothetical protein
MWRAFVLLALSPDLFFLAAHARSPDIQVEVSQSGPLSIISGRLQPEQADALFWVDQSEGRLFSTELVGGQPITLQMAEAVRSVTALVDYDGDGRNNLVVSLGSGYLDVESGQPLDAPSGPGNASPGDVNGDGFGDFARHPSLWLGHEEGLRQGPLFPGENEVDPEIYALGDLDGDRRGDLARLNFQSPWNYGMREGTLDLYLGCEFAEPIWLPHWSYDHPTEGYGPGLALTPADLDGDGEDELLVLSGKTDPVGYGVTGELQVLDDLLDPLGPTVVVSRDVGPNVGFAWPVLYSLLGMGDLDGDGDDEVLAVGSNFADDGYVRFIDAEPTLDGLFQIVGPSFDLPVSNDIIESGGNLQALVGDYNGDSWRDVVLILTWAEPNDSTPHGIIAFWLTPPPEGAPPETETSGTPDLSHCQPPPAEEPPATEDPEEPPESSACLGCATSRPPGAWLLLALPWLARRRIPGAR